MKVFVKPQAGLSRAMDRVAKGLTASIAAVEPVDNEADAEFVLIHAIGYPETYEAVIRCKGRGQKVAIAQYCVRTTQEEKTDKWLALWQAVDLVWSYYDLAALCVEDGNLFRGNFYYSPLGVDSSVFFPQTDVKKFKALSTGYVAESESITEVNTALWNVREKHIHIGPDNLDLMGRVECHVNVSDEDIALYYSQSEYVTGLRRIEGFELPCAEGLLCGARPVMFDRPHYRQWFGDFAEFIPEGDCASVEADLSQVFSRKARPVSGEERARAADAFSWPRIAAGFWSAAGILPAMKSAPVPAVVPRAPGRPRVLYVGDVGVSSGFARAAERGILAELWQHFDVTALGINYIGDPHDLPYKIYPCADYYGGDAFGSYRLPKLCKTLNPDLLIIQQDPWNVPEYFAQLKKSDVDVPAIGSIAVDGLNCRGRALRGLKHAAFWTEFGRDEAVKGGFDGPTSVIPLGVDLDIYHPVDRQAVRKQLPVKYRDGFIVGNVNRNQPRKRLDLTIAYFAEWVKTYNIPDAYLLFHIAPTGDRGYDVKQLMNYYGVFDRLILSEPEIGKGDSEDSMRSLYNAFDVQVTTTQGEGWGLTTIEGMACGVPQIVPNWSGLGEWTRDAAIKIDCIRETCVTPNDINSIGGVVSSLSFIEALHRVYSDREYRREMATRGMTLASQPEFRWEAIAKQWLTLVEGFFAQQSEVLQETVSA